MLFRVVVMWVGTAHCSEPWKGIVGRVGDTWGMRGGFEVAT